MTRIAGTLLGLGAMALVFSGPGCGPNKYKPQAENTLELCSDGIDNDKDGLTDCEDPDCAEFPHCYESNCTDGIDNDGDGLVDCFDPDCLGDPACVENTSELCSDGVDNDGDGFIDCLDPDCWDTAACIENTPSRCQDGIDNDGNGLIDCEDPKCQALSVCIPVENTDELCSDGIDNDGDGLTDCDDPDCAQTVPCGGFCTTLTFERPATFGMAIVQANDDEDPNTDCVQYTVRVVAASPQPDTQVCLYLDSLSGVPVACADPNIANPVVFPGVTLCQGSHSLYARVEKNQYACDHRRMDVIVYEDPTCTITLPAGLSVDPSDPTLVNVAAFPQVQVSTSGARAELFVNNLIFPTVNAVGGIVTYNNVALGADGPVEIRATCHNPGSGTGSTQSQIRYLSKDTVAPVITIHSPTAGAQFGAGSCPITASVTVQGGSVGQTVCASVQGSSPSVDGCAEITSSTSQTVSLEVPCINGNPATIEAYSEDLHGNVGSATVEVVIDTDIPAVIIQSPIHGRLYNKADDTINPATNTFEHNIVACTDRDYNPANITLTINSLVITSITPTVAAASCSGLSHRVTWSAPFPFIQDPSGFPTNQTLRVQISDGINVGSAQISFQNDTIAPTMNLTCTQCEPKKSFYIASEDKCPATPQFDVAANVQITGIGAGRPVTLSVTNGGIHVGGSPYIQNTTIVGTQLVYFQLPCGVVLQNGQNRLQFDVTDAAGNPAVPLVKVVAIGQGVITSPGDNAILGPDDDCDSNATHYGIPVSVQLDPAIGNGKTVTVYANSNSAPWTHSQSWISDCASQGATCFHTFCVSVPVGVAEQTDISLSLEVDGSTVPGGPQGIIIDITPPDPATDPDLNVLHRRAPRVELSWRSVEDPQTGLLDSWELRCLADAIIDGVSWSTAQVFGGLPAPAAAGTVQSVVISEDTSGNKLRYGHSYSCALRGVNKAGLPSDLMLFPTLAPADFGFQQSATVIEGYTRANREYGFYSTVAGGGDLDGDGFDDMLVGYGLGNPPYDPEEHAAAIFFGGAGGPSSSRKLDISCADGTFGGAMVGIGDFDGNVYHATNDPNRYPDFAISSRKQDRVYVFRGRGSLQGSGLDCSQADVTIIGPPGGCFGTTLAAAGDFDGDGLNDLAIGMYCYDGFKGTVFIVFGRDLAGGPITIDLVSGANANGTIRIDGLSGLAGRGLAGADLDRDGFTDLLITSSSGGTNNRGQLWVLKGFEVTKAPHDLTVLSAGDLDQVISFLGPVANASFFGVNSTVAMDFDGDGCTDAVVGAAGANQGTTLTNSGNVLAYLGGKSGSLCTGVLDSSPSAVVHGAATWDLFGMVTVGNTNMTGEAPSVYRLNGELTSPTDLAFVGGAPQHNRGTQTSTGPGYAKLFFAGFSGTDGVGSADVHFEAPVGSTAFHWVGFVGDLNGDGYVDLAIGDTEFAPAGRLVIYQ